MADKRTVDDLSIEELEQVLAIRKREERLKRVRRMEENGRLVGVTPWEQPTPPPIELPPVEPAGATTRYQSTPVPEDEEAAESWFVRLRQKVRIPPINWRWIGNRLLFLVEVTAVIGLVWILWDTWQTRQELNREATEAQQAVIHDNFPTPSPTPLIGVVLLPGGHTSPLSEGGSRPVEAGGIPEHLLPLVAAYESPPIPTPGPEQARRIVIPKSLVDHPIVQGDSDEQLKKGVGQHIGSATPGTAGNLVLTAHNDIHGEIFRHLDKLQVGDEITVYTSSREFVYVVQSQRIVEPTDVDVMAPTRKPTITLISCYPYLLDTQRIVIIGVLKEEQ